MKSSSSAMRLVLCFLAAAVIGAMGSAFAADSGQVKQLKETRSCPGCDLSGADLSTVQLQRANLLGANLADARFYASNLRNADLSGANLNGANFSKANLQGATGADLTYSITTSETVCPDGSRGPCR